jgi:hypothetical protein
MTALLSRTASGLAARLAHHRALVAFVLLALAWAGAWLGQAFGVTALALAMPIYFLVWLGHDRKVPPDAFARPSMAQVIAALLACLSVVACAVASFLQVTWLRDVFPVPLGLFVLWLAIPMGSTRRIGARVRNGA